jgi:hypothetical protein
MDKSVIVLALSIIILASALFYHSSTDRYQIAAIGSVMGVYLVDTRSGDISICSPVSENGCMTLAEFRVFIEKRNNDARKKVKDFAKEKTDGVVNTLKNLDFRNKDAAPSSKE